MLSPNKIKEELQTNVELNELLEALKAIAASEFRILEKQKERFALFAEIFEGFFTMVDLSKTEHPFVRSSGKLGIIMVTSDEGFMGGLNTEVIAKALELPDAASAELIVIGKKGANYFESIKRKFTFFPGISSEKRYESALQLKNYIIEKSLKEGVSRFVIFYPKALSFTAHTVAMLKLLPCTELFEQRQEILTEKEEVLAESSVKHIIEYLAGTYLSEKLFEAFEDSKLAEFSARTIRLEESHQMLLGMGKKLKFQYFRSRRENINKSMLDMFAGSIVRKQKMSGK